MSGCLAFDETMPALTSRLLLLLEDEDDLLVLKPQNVPTTGMMYTSRLEESKEESPVVVSPICNTLREHRRQSDHWSSARFDTIPECGLPSIPSCPLPIPTTPLSTKGLFATFPSSPMPQDLWQYGEACPSFLSPRTTDAVFEEKKAAAEAVWCNKAAMIPNLPPMTPSLEISANSNRSRDCPPSFILYQSRSGSYCGALDDDEVSLLADDPDEDDAGVLPPATYDVVVNILDEIDRDSSN
mmetsp:Transcript_19121/g.47558  ORF Transcript_19121/g.47558 Transcript_19121/m.47558 type:complete len:241 (-) Transcript_19121:3475-4197(-)